jgi:4-hydroxy-3-polyprenylbenzoate decarboxylase
MAVEAPAFTANAQGRVEAERFCAAMDSQELTDVPLIILTDDSSFTAATLNNYLWVTYTRSNPSHDIYGVKSFTEDKHWGCRGSLVIDARKKPHHAPELIPDPDVQRSVQELLKKYGYGD